MEENMRKLLLSIILIIFIITPIWGQYPLKWANYKLMNPSSDVIRSLSYNKATDHLLVATRRYGVDVIILSAATGDSIGKLDTGIITGGTYFVNMVAVADDGTIYVSNLTAPQYTPGSTFKVYRYADENAAPELVFDSALDGGRYGDSFAAIGTGNNKYIYSSGMGNPKMVVLKDDGSATLTLDGYITLPQPGAARHGISPVSPGGKIWINGADTGFPPPTLINSDGSVIAIVPDTLASPGGTSCIKHLILGEYNLITVTNAWALSIRSVRFFEDELGTVTFGYFGSDCDSIPILYNGTTFINNVNGTTSLDYDPKRHAIFTLFGFNSITSLSLDSLLKASTPRSGALEISVNGKMDFFPTDYVGSSNGRDMYLTWSEGKVFVGVTGHTLIDPTETNRMYVAFDLDPNGANGSTLPPEPAGGVSSLPFKADVVFMVESYKNADYMLGNIYKWNGTTWAMTQFDGNFASQGALAYADEGDRKLAEFAAVKNDPGLGDKFTSVGIMVYVAEKDALGKVLCAFPPGNPIGTGVAFGRYYYADSLGSGMFPADTMYVKLRGFSTAVQGNKPAAVPNQFVLNQNYPNPFNPETTISYELPRSASVSIQIYDITGRLVETLINGKQSAGKHTLKFSADRLSSGVYFYRLTADKNVLATKKMVVLK